MSLLKRPARALSSQPLIYQIIQNLLGQNVMVDRLRRHAVNISAPLLDVGSSVGAVTEKLRLEATSIDIDVLAILQAKGRRVVADAGALPFLPRCFRTAMMVAVSHHLATSELQQAFRELARVCADRLVFADAVRNDSRFLSRLLWRYDRGADPRTEEELVQLVERDFTITSIERFEHIHQYVLLIAIPRVADG